MPAAPLISVVIPVHNAAEYLQECLDSVLGQPVRDIEVIAVDGHSADKSGAILNAAALADGRVRVLTQDQKIWPGQARNTGLQAARGDYVWFVDADDVLPPGSLGAVAGAARQGRPDLVLVDFEYLEADGRTRPSPGRDLLGRAPAGGFRLADWPDAIELTATVWSKVFRRDFLIGLGTAFSPGIHEDVPVSFAALLRAAKISVLNRVCYRYRQRAGSYMATASEHHFDIFASYREVLELASGAAGATAQVRAALFDRAIWHYTTNLDGERVPRRLRRRYFSQMHEEYLARRPAGYRRPRGCRGLKYRLIERDMYRVYAAALPVNRLRLRMLRAGARAAPPAGPAARQSG
jgi:CDP-glycerol glycerophosphotransferase